MSIINPQTKEIICKIVYYGPALSGKTTSLLALQDKVKSRKGKLNKEISSTDRTLFFDFVSFSSRTKIKNYKTKFQVYTVPGQVLYEDSRKLLLNGVDGIIFVVDSSLEYIEDSLRSLKELRFNLQKLGYNPDSIPMVIQYNKRDSHTAANLKELEKIINPDGLPSFESVAKKGSGVLDAFETLLGSILLDLKEAA